MECFGDLYSYKIFIALVFLSDIWEDNANYVYKKNIKNADQFALHVFYYDWYRQQYGMATIV